MNINTTIRLENLTTGYKAKNGADIVVERNINESLHSGELTCLLGPNGAGKSTLLKTLSAFIAPLDGKIFIENKDLGKFTDSEIAKTIGVVLTERIDLDNMPVEQLVGMGRSPYTGFWGRLSTADREIVDEAIALVKIDDLRGRMIYSLSDGERQKVMIAKALAQQTPVIFLDEPTAFLDYPSKVELMQLLHYLSRIKNKTIFLSTHDLEMALQIADKIWLIDKKYGVTTGTPEDLSLSGEMKRYFTREGIDFDMTTGLFRINPVKRGEINLSGDDSDVYFMARKALARIGMTITDSPDAPHRITATSTGITVDDAPVTNIDNMLSAISIR